MWYVIQTTSGQEHNCIELCKTKVDTELYDDIFVPMYVEKKRYNKKWHEALKVLFPGYFFIETDKIDEVYKALKSVERFTRILQNADAVSPITEQEQSFLKSIMDEDYVVSCSTGMIIGDKICITSGPLADHCGLIKKIDRHKRKAWIDVEIFGRLTPAEVGLEILTKLSEEEFRNMLGTVENEEEATTAATSEDKDKKMVRIISGVFAGMEGKLLSADEKKDQWKIEVKVFGTPTSVIFTRQEIKLAM